MKNFLTTLLLWFFICPSNAATLVGWAQMPMRTVAEGPATGHFAHSANATNSMQLVQGFSGVLKASADDHFYFLTDNGFGKKSDSADFLPRIYDVQIDFIQNTQQKTQATPNQNNQVTPHHFININDRNNKLTLDLQANHAHYYNDPINPLVNKRIRENRWLTGADIDPESLRIDKNGQIWIGDEFGPFLIKINQSGQILRAEISLPGVVSPDFPRSEKLIPNLASTGGFEGMAINPAGDMLYPMLEGTVDNDPEKTLRIYQFDINDERYTDQIYHYKLEEQATSIGDFTAINDHEFLVLERNSAVNLSDKPFKKIYLVDFNKAIDKQPLEKRELVDLMQLKDPQDLNKDGKTDYAFAYSHIENLLIIDKDTLLVANDNNYIGNTCFIKIKLENELNLAKFIEPKIDAKDWVEIKSRQFNFNFGDHSFFGWTTVLVYLLAAMRTGYKAKLTFTNKENCYFWLGVTFLLVLLGLNKQLDLQTDFTELLRTSARAHGWYEARRGYQILFISTMALAIPLLLIYLRLFLSHSWQRYKLAWLGIAGLLFYIVVRAASFHHVDLIFYRSIGSLRYYQGLEMLAIGVIVAGTYFENTRAITFKSSQEGGNKIVTIQAEGELINCPSCGKKPLSESRHGRLFKCKQCKQVYVTSLDQSVLMPSDT